MSFLIALLAAGAAAAGVVTAAVLLGRRTPALERRLVGYERHEVVPIEGEASKDAALLQQAKDLTDRVAMRTGVRDRVSAALERAEMPVRASELIFYVVVIALLAFMLLSILVGPLVGIAAGAAALFFPILYVRRRQEKRLKAFERQLPDTLALLASSLRSGFSFMQGLEAIAQEVAPPMRSELQRVFTEVRLGRPVEDALTDAAQRMGSNDLAWAVMAIKIQREVGGNLAVLLDTVADTMKQRENMRREVRSLTAEGRLSAMVLTAAPIALGTFLLVVSPTYLAPLFDTLIGVIMVGLGVALLAVGAIWLRKLTDIEV